ncbi:hypothetical protein OGM63_17920 [Plectonema radiosum NIES-515]|uniref:Transmembrane protein n=1 Tax=Plectonema radiosum NIES-515 TaxID=2986073 RepID=A0ABT3B1X3_9CYAN|nr:hypothetical protein [Plectonema radiosum]MCV3215367.1 hypothetical protein [Plectonema radiosum NIES-515]
MENNQNVQQEPTQATALTADKVKKKSKSIDSLMLLIHLLARYPWLLLVGLLGMFLGSATLAIYSLGYAGHVEQEEPETIQAEVAQPINTPSETSNPTPLWMVAAIAFSCASGCLIIFRFLNRPTQRQKDQKRINRDGARLARRHHQKLEPRPPENYPVFVPPSQSMSFAPVPSKRKPMVTVLPPEHTIPFDKSKESLADMLDIRKQNSLSAILRK